MKKAFDREFCDCPRCRRLCQGVPGWFMPGEATKAAEYLKMDLILLFKDYLIIEYWVSSPEDILVLSPRTARQDGKTMACWGDPLRDSPCKFLDESGCMLPLELRPIECAITKCHKVFARNPREIIKDAWKENQTEIDIVYPKEES